MLQPVIKEGSEEAAVEELTGKETTPEEVNIEAIALEEVPIVNTLPCLEEVRTGLGKPSRNP